MCPRRCSTAFDVFWPVSRCEWPGRPTAFCAAGSRGEVGLRHELDRSGDYRAGVKQLFDHAPADAARVTQGLQLAWQSGVPALVAAAVLVALDPRVRAGLLRLPGLRAIVSRFGPGIS